MQEEEGDLALEPFTKAKLFTSSAEDGSWTEMGIGVVSIALESPAEEEEEERMGGSGKLGKACSQDRSQHSGSTAARSAKLKMVDLANEADVLMMTPVSLDDIYMVQHESILVWSDPELGRSMACSFNTREGCEAIMNDIRAFQKSEQDRLAGTPAGARIRPSSDRWSVLAGNLPAILDAATNEPHRFGIYVRDHSDYFEQLAALFDTCAETGDEVGRDVISKVVLALLRSPYNTEGKIIAQFVENAIIDKCIDIVQYGIGRRDAKSGFVTFEQRRATFQNPCHLPEPMLSRIHVLYSCGYLKDLLPLSLEEGDASASSLLSTFLMRFKYTLMDEICSSEEILPDAFERTSQDSTSDADVYALMNFVNDMSRTIKNSMLPLDPKESLFRLLVDAGAMKFVNVVLRRALDALSKKQQQHGNEKGAAEWMSAPGRALQMACDTVSHCLTMLPDSLDALTSEASSPPRTCTAALLMQCLTLVYMSSELQAAFDAIVAAGVGLVPTMLFLGGDTANKRRAELLKFWICGDGIESPPLFTVAAHVAKVLKGGATDSTSTTASVLTTTIDRPTELQLQYCLRMLQTIVREAPRRLGESLAQLLLLSQILPTIATLLHMEARRLADLQASAISFVASLLNGGDARLLVLLKGQDALLEVIMGLYLRCCRRQNILTSSMAHFFMLLCECVHEEKASAGLPSTADGPSPFVTIMHSEDSMPDGTKPGTTITIDGATGETQSATSSQPFQTAASDLVASYGDRLAECDPMLAKRLRFVIEETPEEAQQIEAETSSMASALDRNTSLSGLSEFEAMALEFGVDATYSRSPSNSPTHSPIPMDNPHAALLEMSEEDSHFYSDEEEEQEEGEEGETAKALNASSEDASLDGATAGTRESSVGEKHAREETPMDENNKDDDEERGGNSQPKRQRAEESAVETSAA